MPKTNSRRSQDSIGWNRNTFKTVGPTKIHNHVSFRATQDGAVCSESRGRAEELAIIVRCMDRLSTILRTRPHRMAPTLRPNRSRLIKATILSSQISRRPAYVQRLHPMVEIPGRRPRSAGARRDGLLRGWGGVLVRAAAKGGLSSGIEEVWRGSGG